MITNTNLHRVLNKRFDIVESMKNHLSSSHGGLNKELYQIRDVKNINIVERRV
jgi:hypothetical protein